MADPYRNEGDDVKYHSKWDLLITNISLVAVGFLSLLKDGSKKSFFIFKRVSQFTFFILTGVIWAPVLLFWVRGLKQNGASFFKDHEQISRFNRAKERFEKGWNGCDDEDTINHYKNHVTIPIVKTVADLHMATVCVLFIDAFLVSLTFIIIYTS